jgi:DNA-binding response OmpR family regulator
VLDVGMPEMDGLEVCRQIRKTSDTPILFLSARDEEIDRILGLEIGGDDYVTTILRRARQLPALAAATKTMSYGGLAIDPGAHTASFLGTPVALTALEFAILRTLLARPGFVFTRELILDAAYAGNIHVADRTIDSHVRNIRANLADNAMRHGSTRLDIIAERHGNMLRVTVADNGEGVSANNRAQIFDSFFTTRRDSGGTGMGLAIVRAMLDAHGGAICLLEVAQGTAFELMLPASDAIP